VLALLAAAAAGAGAQAQGLFEGMRDASSAGQPGGYVFVSERVSDTSLIPLARDAQRAGLTIVLNGFWGDLNQTRQRVARINDACCGKHGARWQINPLLFQRYQVTAAPSFVLSVGPGSGAQDFSKVTGEMSVANALKAFAQQSKLPAVRRFAALTYTKAFASQ
jgi:conjugal transfer pilus assembly protein TrbC